MDLALRFFRNNTSEMTKGFSDIQMDKLMGWYGVTRCVTPQKSGRRLKKLKHMRTSAWYSASIGKKQENINVQFYDIYWYQDILTALQKVMLEVKTGHMKMAK